ncbi:MAG: hypothetical protein ACLFN7_06550 [Candidatus Acetothermia bacterium]
MVFKQPRARLAFAVVLFSVLLVFSGVLAGAQEEEECCLYMEEPDCPERYSSLNPSEDVYSPGDTVEIELSGLNDEYLMEEIEIRKVGSDREVVYTEVVNASVSEDENSWTWQWNQVGNSGEQVDTDHYFALLETECCGIYRTDFRIQRQVKPVCCTRTTKCNCRIGWNARLDSACSRYETGEGVDFTFSNCNNCDVTFESLEIKRSSRCCGGTETVYQREFQDGYNPGQSWSWNWDQRDASGELVQPGRYTLVINTECCSSLRTEFMINERRDRCSCSGGLFSLFSCCGCN